MNELLLRRPLAAWGAPATMSVTSLRDLPQNEQRTPGAFILAIISVLQIRKLTTCLMVAQLVKLRFFKARKLATCATRGAQSPRLLNHIPWPRWQTNIDRARHRARWFPYPAPYASQGFATSARGCVSVP